MTPAPRENVDVEPVDGNGRQREGEDAKDQARDLRDGQEDQVEADAGDLETTT